jgi:MFS family permease
VGNIAEHPYEIQHIPPARHDDPDVVVLGHWILAAAIVGSSMAFINGTVANVALPSIQSDLGATRTEALWVVQAYALLLATLIVVGGSLGDQSWVSRSSRWAAWGARLRPPPANS